MVFANYDGNVDVYMRNNTWQADLWSLYEIDDQSLPEYWHKSMTMRHIYNASWPMDALPDKKRKHDSMTIEVTIDEPGEEAMSTEASIYETALHAMTPIAAGRPDALEEAQVAAASAATMEDMAPTIDNAYTYTIPPPEAIHEPEALHAMTPRTAIDSPSTETEKL